MHPRKVLLPDFGDIVFQVMKRGHFWSGVRMELGEGSEERDEETEVAGVVFVVFWLEDEVDVRVDEDELLDVPWLSTRDTAAGRAEVDSLASTLLAYLSHSSWTCSRASDCLFSKLAASASKQ